jgi:folate-binding protein YgfZ
MFTTSCLQLRPVLTPQLPRHLIASARRMSIHHTHEATMAALSPAAPARNAQYIRNAFRESLRSLRSSRVVTARAFSTASSPNHAHGTCRNKTFMRCAKNRASLRYATSRLYSITFTPSASEHTDGFAPLPHRRLISLSGPDAPKFLQGLITNNVDPLERTSFYSAFLDARGRVLWDVFVWIIEKEGPWACHIEVDGSEVEALKKHLKRHKLRSKVQIEDVGEEEMKVWAAWGSFIDVVGRQETVMDDVERREMIAYLRVSGDAIAVLEDSRALEKDCHRLLTRGDTYNISPNENPVDVQDYHIWRYRHGIPEGPREIPRENALPMEYNFDLSRGIDFKKGCYVGQELTIRTKHTGIVRKRVLPVTLSLVRPSPGGHPESTTPSVPPEYGADIKQLDCQGSVKKGRAAGKFIAGIGNVGLALCRLENMTSMKASVEGGTWKEGMAFGCETKEGVVRVEPVLHDEFLVREQILWHKNSLKRT